MQHIPVHKYNWLPDFSGSLPALLLFKEMEITAIAAISQRFRAAESDFIQPSIGHIIHITKQMA
jgi:hypothetical protein